MFLRQVLVNLVFPIPSIFVLLLLTCLAALFATFNQTFVFCPLKMQTRKIVLDLITKWGASSGTSQPLNGSTLVYIKTKLEQMYNVSKLDFSSVYGRVSMILMSLSSAKVVVNAKEGASMSTETRCKASCSSRDKEALKRAVTWLLC